MKRERSAMRDKWPEHTTGSIAARENREAMQRKPQSSFAAPSGYGHAPGFTCFVDSEIGMTMGDTTVKQLPDGTWKATCPIGTLFGLEVEGECNGTGATKEAALEALNEKVQR